MPSPTIITVAEADAKLSGVSPWSGTSESEKSVALGWAEVYFNDVYSCPNEDLTDSGNIADSIVEAISSLANEQLMSSLFERQSKMPEVKRVKRKTDVLERETEYAVSNVGRKWVDPFPHITALIKPVCSTQKSSSIKTIPLVRR